MGEEQPLWRRLEQLEKVEKTKRHRRWSWCRLDRCLVDDMRWRLVARRTGTPMALIEALVIRLEVFANANLPRGSLEGFSLAALAAYWDLPNEDELARVYAALKHPDVGWIDQDHLVTFWERNPDVEDTTAAERQRRFRARRKEEKEKAAAALESRADRATPREKTRTQKQAEAFARLAALRGAKVAPSETGGAPAPVTPLLKVRSA